MLGWLPESMRTWLRRQLAEQPPAPMSRSRLAVPGAKMWDAGDRPKAWQDREYGLVVHTTGGGLPSKALARGLYPTVLGTEVYNQSHGCHYLCGWKGVDGDLLQLADDREQANGVGVRKDEPEKNQWTSVKRGRHAWEEDLPDDLVKAWRARWPGWANPLDLLPGTDSANAPYLHLELIPCVFSHNGKLHTAAEPLTPGLRFTRAQHDGVADLARDLADRKGWWSLSGSGSPFWWRTPRLLGHEDLTPLSRHDKLGGWDPGALRGAKYFDWEYVYRRIAEGYGATHVDVGGLVMARRELVRTKPGKFAQY
jgi:hypothetical protein